MVVHLNDLVIAAAFIRDAERPQYGWVYALGQHLIDKHLLVLVAHEIAQVLHGVDVRCRSAVVVLSLDLYVLVLGGCLFCSTLLLPVGSLYPLPLLV